MPENGNVWSSMQIRFGFTFFANVSPISVSKIACVTLRTRPGFGKKLRHWLWQVCLEPESSMNASAFKLIELKEASIQHPRKQRKNSVRTIWYGLREFTCTGTRLTEFFIPSTPCLKNVHERTLNRHHASTSRHRKPWFEQWPLSWTTGSYGSFHGRWEMRYNTNPLSLEHQGVERTAPARILCCQAAHEL